MQNVIHVEAHSTILEYLQASPCHWDRESRDIFQISTIYWKTIFFIQFYDWNLMGNGINRFLLLE